MGRRKTVILASVLAGAAALSLGGAVLAVNLVESGTRSTIESRLAAEGLTFASVRTDGLQVILEGSAETEAMRFRALSVAGGVVDRTRVIDRIAVIETLTAEPPRFVVEFLRNDDGISIIGLVPMAFGRRPILDAIGGDGSFQTVSDMLDSADHPIPPGWEAAVAFGLEALVLLPRSKISVSAERVRVTAVSDSRTEQRELERRLQRAAPSQIDVVLEISAPRPVIAPFTLRFAIDADGARFDACAADSEAAQRQILEAGVAAGASTRTPCTIGLGAPSPDWAQAAAAGIGTLAGLGQGTLTLSDDDMTLVVPHSIGESALDAAAGDLRQALPEGFSLAARLLEAPPETPETDAAEFVATLSPEGALNLRGLLADETMREAVRSYAGARFGAASVQLAASLDEALPDGWAGRVMAGLEALSEIDHGTVLVRADRLEIMGRSGNPDASDMVARLLTERLNNAPNLRISVVYDESLDPIASLPSPESCVADIADILAERQITFAPGSATIEGAAAETMDKIAVVLRDCGELRLEIGGHTDSQGRAEMNLALSQRRADAVLEALLARRVLVGGFTARGYGAARPIADNATAAGREANRRIEFRLVRVAPEGVETDPVGRFRDPELEATLVIDVSEADEETLRPRDRPARD